MQFNFKLKYLAIIISIIAGYFFLYNYPNSIEGHTVCAFKNMTGIPCPSCGSTRATMQLLHGKFIKSILINPFGIITNSLVIISTFWMVNDILKNKETFFPFIKKDFVNKYVIIFAVMLTIANWIWNIQKGL